MDFSDVIYNRLKTLVVAVPDDYKNNPEQYKSYIKEIVENKLNYLYNSLLDGVYMKTYIYEIGTYYINSNLLEVNLVNEKTNDNCFYVNDKIKSES